MVAGGAATAVAGAAVEPHWLVPLPHPLAEACRLEMGVEEDFSLDHVAVECCSKCRLWLGSWMGERR
ncbi:hypothetical protein XELAEV_18033147mg [Xenopus laevis]|uniref:Uncharacterized protein n=1 Tax=Xenopus laevis TaxID=8355 RepID=A0A974CIS5_XENLA|nr:hypothetical protein XELAEV_18033147mg [Xenopus laevis]